MPIFRSSTKVWNSIKIEDFDYEINKDGVVRRIRKTVASKDRAQHIDTRGYYSITLYKNGNGYRRSIHRLLAQIFIPNPDNKPCVDHINRIRTDNRLENLRWATYSENNKNTNHKNCVYKCPEQIGKYTYTYYRGTYYIEGKMCRTKRFKTRAEKTFTI